VATSSAQFASREDTKVPIEDDADLQQIPYKACNDAVAKGFVPVYDQFHDPELLDFFNAHRHTQTRKKVAFVLRGELNRAGQHDVEGVRSTKGGEVQQQIVSACHIRNIILPLEKQGYQVDVFAAYYQHDAPFASAILPLYGERVLGTAIGDAKLSNIKKQQSQRSKANENLSWSELSLMLTEYDQGYLIRLGLDLLKKHILDNSVLYDFALLWRWDCGIRLPLNPGE
jgi:hypothetical protein